MNHYFMNIAYSHELAAYKLCYASQGAKTVHLSDSKLHIDLIFSHMCMFESLKCKILTPRESSFSSLERIETWMHVERHKEK